jgi:hypothetical protein
MSLIEMRARWLRATRNIVYPESNVEHFVIAATFTAEPVVPYLGVKYIDDGSALPRISIAPYDQLFQVCLNWKEMFRRR